MTDRSQTSPAGRLSLLTVILCALVAVFEGFDLQAAGVAAPRLAPALGLNSHDLGWFFSASTFGMMLGATAGGRLSDLFGRRFSLFLSISLFGLFSIGTGLVDDLPMLVVARFLTGVGLGGALPTLMTIVAENTPPARRSAAVGALYAGMPCGGATVSLLSLIGGPTDWRLVFYVGGIAPLLVIGFLVWLLPPIAAPVASEASEKKGYIAAVFGEGRAVASGLLWIGFFLGLLILYLLLSWLPLLMIGRGLSRPDAAMVQMAFNVFGAIGSLVTGWLMDRRQHRSLFLTAIFTGAAAMVLIVATAPMSLALSACIGAALGATVMGSQSAIYGLAPSVYPARVRGTGVGVGVAAGRFGSVAGPLLAGQLLGLGRSPGEVLLALLPVIAVAGLATFLLSRRTVAQA